MFKILDIIKYEGNNDTFIWKHPCEDFNCLSQLIVHENQEAVFYMNGQALDLFGSGRYTLKTQNIPIIGLVKLVGTEDDLSQKRLVAYFRSFLMTRIKTYIAKIIKSESINIFEIDEKLSQLSEAIKELLVDDFEDYGISLETFFINRVTKPDGDEQYEKFKELYFRQAVGEFTNMGVGFGTWCSAICR